MRFGMIEWGSEIRDNRRRIVSETEARRRGVDKLLTSARDLSSRGDQHGDTIMRRESMNDESRSGVRQ